MSPTGAPDLLEQIFPSFPELLKLKHFAVFRMRA
jgi:hypothetical protein